MWYTLKRDERGARGMGLGQWRKAQDPIDKRKPMCNTRITHRSMGLDP